MNKAIITIVYDDTTKHYDVTADFEPALLDGGAPHKAGEVAVALLEYLASKKRVLAAAACGEDE